MTSMLLTARYAWTCGFATADINKKGRGSRPAPFAPYALLFLRAVARRDVLFLRVLRRGSFDHRTNDRLVRRDPIRDHLPLLAVPLLELDRRAALMVHAGDLERCHQADRAQLLQALLVDVQVLERPAHLLAGHRLAFAEACLRVADAFRRDDAGDDAARMVDRADARLVVQVALVLAVHVLLHVLHHREARARQVERGRDEAFRR